MYTYLFFWKWAHWWRHRHPLDRFRFQNFQSPDPQHRFLWWNKKILVHIGCKICLMWSNDLLRLSNPRLPDGYLWNFTFNSISKGLADSQQLTWVINISDLSLVCSQDFSTIKGNKTPHVTHSHNGFLLTEYTMKKYNIKVYVHVYIIYPKYWCWESARIS